MNASDKGLQGKHASNLWTEVLDGIDASRPPTTGVWIIAQTTQGKFRRLRYSRAQCVWLTEDYTTITLFDIVRWRPETVRRQRRDKPAEGRKWRGSAEIRGYRSNLQGAINACDNGAVIELDLRTARALVEICLQAEHTEEGHGQ